MTKKPPFLNTDWFWPVIIIAIFIWLIYIWKEQSRFPSPKFYVNSTVSLLALIALTLIVLKPLKPTSNKPFQLAVTTEGFRQEQLDSLKKIRPNLVVRNYSSEEQILKESSIPESVFVLGHGIKSYDLWQLDSVETSYIGGLEIKGITRLKYDANNYVGNPVTFKGRYTNATKNIKLVLESPSGKPIDSILLSSDEKQDFELSADLKIKGNFLYQLIEKDSSENILSNNPLPITVKNQNSLKILIINEFPTFETKYLKNYLAEKGHEVFIRSQLTKDRYKYEYFNMAKRPTVSFNRKNLEALDLMIIDANALSKISRKNRNSIEQSVREDGLGLFIQPNESSFSSNNALASFNFQRNKNTVTTISEWSRAEVNTYSFRFKPALSLQPIKISSTKTLAAYKNLGIGRVGTSIIQNSYELLLNGHQSVYQEIWSNIIERLSKKSFPNSEWEMVNSMVFQNEPADFLLRTKIINPKVLSYENNQIPLTQDIDISSLWKGTTYPKEKGWTQLKTTKDTSEFFNYYVQDSTNWKSIQAYITSNENKRHLNKKKASNINSSDYKSSETVNPIWFFALFMICSGYLWLEPKL